MFFDDALATKRLQQGSSAMADRYSTDEWKADTSAYEALPSYLELEMAAAAALAMYVEPTEEPASTKKPMKPSALIQLSPIEKIITVGITAIALSSLALISNGHYVKAETELSQAILDHGLDPELRRDGVEFRTDFMTEPEVLRPQHAVMPVSVDGGALSSADTL
ncbi:MULTISPECIES: hypothetical protein [unclassified Sinorhizobium]|uniref:hypothetical protein n=1 Tax=unclassified Sinorhizobium TaxID=2613772 RepID=UPI00352321B1